jgi:hypothetical protein
MSRAPSDVRSALGACGRRALYLVFEDRRERGRHGELKLVALDKDDIEIVSAHVQDALVKVADILWQPRE